MDQVRYYVASGVLAPGSQLPSIRAMARSLAVNPSTIVKAYGELEHEGTVVNRQGRGAFIAENGSQMTTNEQREVLECLAKQLWVEAAQLGAGRELVEEILHQEFTKLRNQSPEYVHTN